MNEIIIAKRYRFEAAHFLPRVPHGHPCGRIHGHSYEVIAELKGSIGENTGWLLDYNGLDEAMAPLITAFDHTLLNDVIENPTAELLACWFLSALRDHPVIGPYLYAITVKETDKTSATIRA